MVDVSNSYATLHVAVIWESDMKYILVGLLVFGWMGSSTAQTVIRRDGTTRNVIDYTKIEGNKQVRRDGRTNNVIDYTKQEGSRMVRRDGRTNNVLNTYEIR